MRPFLCALGLSIVCLTEASTGFITPASHLAVASEDRVARSHLDRPRPLAVPLQRQGSRAQLRSNSDADLVGQPSSTATNAKSAATLEATPSAPEASGKFPRSQTRPFLLSEECPAEEEATLEAEERASQEQRRPQAEFLALQAQRERLRMENKQLKQQRDAHRRALRQEMAAAGAAEASRIAKRLEEEEERFNKVLERRAVEESARVARLHVAMNEKVRLWEEGFEEVMTLAEEIDQARTALAIEAKLRSQKGFLIKGRTSGAVSSMAGLERSAGTADPAQPGTMLAQERADSVHRDLAQDRRELEERDEDVRRRILAQQMYLRLSAETDLPAAPKEERALVASRSRSPSPDPRTAKAAFCE